MNEIVIRKAALPDLSQVRQLLVEIVGTLDIYSEAARTSEISQYDHDVLARISEDGLFLVAVLGEEICGFCFGYDDDALLWLSWFIVDPRMRGQGIGEQLIREFLAQAAALTHKVWCDTRSNNEASKIILRRCGFEELMTIQRHWYDQDFTIWQKFVK